MPSISKRGLNIPESPIRKLVPFARKAKEEGKKVYHLNIGQPDIETPLTAREAIHHLDLKVWEYSMSEGNDYYRNALMKYYHRLGFTDLSNTHFVATTGGSEALMLLFATICDEGDEVIIPEPYYANYNTFLYTYGMSIVPIVSVIENNFALPPIEDIEKKITSKTKAILLCNPNNPTGYLYSYEELEKIKDIALKYNIFVIVDEVYREYVYDGDHHSILGFPELYEHAIVIDSESKRYSMCGVRLGYLVSRNKDVLQAVIKLAQARLSPPLLAQIAATAAHENDLEYLNVTKQEYTRRRNVLYQSLLEIPDIKCSYPHGAFYCMLELPVDDAENFSKWLLSDFSYHDETVMLAPANGFYSNPELGKKQVRIAYVLNEEDLKKSVTILKKALEAYPYK